ncbi:MAG TPA: sulfite exporter TauE/SafE family protein [Syntrophobacteraceae bacterium]|nr:sulfite exporter TauE/SafE family protein [Syntrophobacteraceae bacterium]
MFDFAIAGIQSPVFLLVLTGLTVGIVGGFIGVGGGYMVTPALIVFGFPGYMASGIDVTHIAGKSVVATIRHRQLGNIDWTLGLAMVGGTMMGVEWGVRLLNMTKKAGVSGIALLSATVVIMLSLFIYTQIETRKAHKQIEEREKSGAHLGREHKATRLPEYFQKIPLFPIVRCHVARIVISMWVIVVVGICTGLLAGFFGVGGGFIRVPALVYIIGATTHIAVGTDLLEIVVSGGYGALRQSMSGNVDMMAVLFMISGAMIGAQFGALATSFVRGPAIRYILSYSLILATVGAFMRLGYLMTGGQYEILSFAAVVFTLGEMIFLCLFIMSLVIFAARHKAGKPVPNWIPSLVVKD